MMNRDWGVVLDSGMVVEARESERAPWSVVDRSITNVYKILNFTEEQARLHVQQSIQVWGETAVEYDWSDEDGYAEARTSIVNSDQLFRTSRYIRAVVLDPLAVVA